MKNVISDSPEDFSSAHNEFPTEKDIEYQDYFVEIEAQDRESKPKLVFKYKSVSSVIDLVRLCDIFKNNKIYIPQLNELNDPLESTNGYLDGIKEEERERYFRDYRVLSLSADPFLPTLWAYYADNYKGICLGFWTNGSFSEIKPMNYDNSQKSILWELNPDDLLIKGEAWRHEAEYRIVKKGEANTYLSFDTEDLACVIFGCKMDKEIRDYIESCIPNDLPILTIKSSKSKFSLYAESNSELYTIKEMISDISKTRKMPFDNS